MKWYLDARYSHNDMWTVFEFGSMEDLQSECVHLVMNGWETKLNEKTFELEGFEELIEG